MSELKVWVDGKERVIRGVSEETTCESVLIALAKAAGKSGRVALLEKWRDLERILPRTEKPIKCLQMWGKLQHEVQFFLRDDTASQLSMDIERRPSIDLASDKVESDPVLRSLDAKSLEARAVNQASKISRLARASEILDTQLAFWTENEEASLYYTEEEIGEELSIMLSKIIQQQEGELRNSKAVKKEFDTLKERNKKLIANIESFRDKLSSVEARITDLDSTGSKLYSQLEHLSVKDRKQVSNQPVHDELKALRLELCKQKALSDTQSLELKHISRSMREVSRKVDQRTTRVGALENELHPVDVYYDLDENFYSTSPEKYDEFDDPVLTLQEIKDTVDFISRTRKEISFTNGFDSPPNGTRSDLQRETETITLPDHRNHDMISAQRKRIPPLNGIRYGNYSSSEDDTQKVEYVDVSQAARKVVSETRPDPRTSSRNAKYLQPPAGINNRHHKHHPGAMNGNDLCDQGVFV